MSLPPSYVPLLQPLRSITEDYRGCFETSRREALSEKLSQSRITIRDVKLFKTMAPSNDVVFFLPTPKGEAVQLSAYPPNS